MPELTDKVAIVTGASRGIGAAIARSLAESGANVILAARSADAITELADELTAVGHTAIAKTADVANYEDVSALVAIAQREYGRLDILINNAGLIEPIARLADSDPDQWVRAADVNYKGVYFGLRAALPVMAAQGSGVIVTISSGAATGALEGWSHYCSSKAAALSLTKCADREYHTQGVRVVGLSPGTVATDMQMAIKSSGVNPVSQMSWDAHRSPEDVGKAVVWLCTDAAADLHGVDFTLKTPEERARAGLTD
ncbi:MAG: SDR family oxidoreductase [Pseudomonadota bacterium]